MGTLKGQNLRVAIYENDLFPNDLTVVAMSTNCTITLTGNTENAETKDDTGMASKPTIVSKAWSVQADSLSVLDAATLLAAIKAGKKLQLAWDETSTTDNVIAQTAAFGRKGYAFINDLTLNFNDRENSAKNVQFIGTEALETVASADIFIASGTPSYTKGQFVRLFLGSDNSATPSKVIAAAKQLSLHVSVTMENATTKDTEGEWIVNEPTALAYDISSNALVRSGETITSTVAAQALADIESIFEAGDPVKWLIANVSGSNQRTKGTVIVSGSAIISSLTLNGPSRANATYDTQMQGYGDYTVGA